VAHGGRLALWRDLAVWYTFCALDHHARVPEVGHSVVVAIVQTGEYWARHGAAHGACTERDSGASGHVGKSINFIVTVIKGAQVNQSKMLPNNHGILRCAKLDPAAKIPRRAHADDAGFDLYALHSTWVLAQSSTTVRTGVGVGIPEGYYGRVASRSGLSVKHNVEVGAGVIDAGYRGEIIVKLYNHGDGNVLLSAGDRVAQLIVTAIYSDGIQEVASLDDTERGAGGFGSTGK